MNATHRALAIKAVFHRSPSACGIYRLAIPDGETGWGSKTHREQFPVITQRIVLTAPILKCGETGATRKSATGVTVLRVGKGCHRARKKVRPERQLRRLQSNKSNAQSQSVRCCCSRQLRSASNLIKYFRPGDLIGCCDAIVGCSGMSGLGVQVGDYA